MKLPKNNKNIKAVKMILESIAHQFNTNEVKKLYSEKEILAELKTSIEKQYYFRLENMQFNIIDYINELGRLQLKINNALLIRTQSNLINTSLIPLEEVNKFNAKLYNSDFTEEVLSEEDYKALNNKFSESIETIKTGTDEIKKAIKEQLEKDMKKYYVITSILKAVGNVWGIKDYIEISNTFTKELEKMKVLNKVNVFNVKISQKTVEKIEEIVSIIDTHPPIYYGYYLAFEEFEDEVEVEVLND